MFVKYLSVENGEVPVWVMDPPWVLIHKAIHELDGRERTTVNLETMTQTHMTIGGGPDYCVVYATADKDAFYILHEPGKAEGSVEMMVGRKPGQYPTETVVGKAVALKVAEFFTDTGELDPTVHWRQSGGLEISEE